MRFATTGAEAPVDVAPDLLQDRGDAPEVPKIGDIAQFNNAPLEERAEGRRGGADRTTDEVDPDEAAVVTTWPFRDELQYASQLLDEADTAGLAWCETRDKAAQVDAGSQAEGGSSRSQGSAI